MVPLHELGDYRADFLCTLLRNMKMEFKIRPTNYCAHVRCVNLLSLSREGLIY